MTIQGYTFNTLTAYLKWLRQRWHSFEEPVWTLENYLEFGRFMWTEVWCLK